MKDYPFYIIKTKGFKIYINQNSERYEVFGVKEFKKTVTIIKGEIFISRINFTLGEGKELLQILERYLPDLEREMADTERKEFRQELKKREVMMRDLIKRLKTVVD